MSPCICNYIETGPRGRGLVKCTAPQYLFFIWNCGACELHSEPEKSKLKNCRSRKGPLKAIWSNSPAMQRHLQLHQVLTAPSSLPLGDYRDRAPIISLGRLFQCFTTLTEKKTQHQFKSSFGKDVKTAGWTHSVWTGFLPQKPVLLQLSFPSKTERTMAALLTRCVFSS